MTARRRGKRADARPLEFRLGIERSSDAIFMTDPDGAITYVNPAFEKLYGFTSDEALGKTPRLLKSGAQGPEFYEQLWARLLERQVVPMALVNRTKGGKLVHVDASANPILDESGALIGYLAIHRDVTERRIVEEQLRRSDQALRESEEQYRRLFDSSPVPTWVFDLTTLRFVAVNDAMVRHYGYSREELLRMTTADIRAPEDVPRLLDVLRSASPGAGRYGIWRHKRKDGGFIDADITGHTMDVRGRRWMIVYAEDVTEKRALEEQFRQAQKMEAVGRLAGGVAHDFNNVLSVVLSYAALALDTLPLGNPLREDIAEIEKAGRRGTELTGQLLALCRRQVLEPKIVDLNESLSKTEKMLRRLLGEDIELEMARAPALWSVEVDPGQIDQLVMNLAVNARDAMPGGGRLTIETANVDLEDEQARRCGAKPGPHVMLAVSDTGTGMDEVTRSHIFEPFFTTKEVGKGTGLGLSTVFGIVKQSGGAICVSSEVGVGTTFTLYFPRVERPTHGDVVHPSTPPHGRGGETILFTEDEEQVRHLVCGILQRHGYEVLVAASAAEALLLCERHPGRIHLLLTDVVMPGMNGHELAHRVTGSRPETSVLYVSGYTGSVVVDHGVLEGAPFLAKPITPAALLRKVREVLDGSR